MQQLIKAERALSLRAVRESYFQNPDYGDDRLTEDYLSWVNQKTWVIIYDRKEDEYKAIRGVKRGDDFYARRTIARFLNLKQTCRKVRCRTTRHKTQALWVTLTYDPKQHSHPGGSAWVAIGKDWNRFISALRRRFGRIQTIRTWEAHKSGAPHIHAILLFEKAVFETFVYNGKIRVSIAKGTESNKKPLEIYWEHGFSDWLGIYDLEGAIGYLSKYLSKTLYRHDDKAEKTLSKCWLHRKRSFSISRRLERLDLAYCNSNGLVGQLDLLGGIVTDEHRYRLVGCIASMVELTKYRIDAVVERPRGGFDIIVREVIK